MLLFVLYKQTDEIIQKLQHFRNDEADEQCQNDTSDKNKQESSPSGTGFIEFDLCRVGVIFVDIKTVGVKIHGVPRHAFPRFRIRLRIPIGFFSYATDKFTQNMSGAQITPDCGRARQ